MPFADIWLAIGTRPEAIKMAPVAHALAARGLDPTLILTGQHPQLDAQEFGLSSVRMIRFKCAGDKDPHRHVRQVTAQLLRRLRTPPELVVVQGDTSSALGAALAAFTARVPVAHVEAGLRTHDPLLPWPEEEYRAAIDAQADLLFAPTEAAARNLEHEAVPGEVHITGNTGIDALLAVERTLPAPAARECGTPQILVTCHRRESWGEGLQSIAAALRALTRTGAANIDFVLHPNPHIAKSMRELLGGRPHIALVSPCTHSELVERMRGADLILSDSGGIQEEAPALGVPLLVLREKTERPEAITSGNARLVGTSTERVIAETQRLLNDPLALATMARRAFPFGDGRAAPKIAALIARWLEQRSSGARRTG